jgi:hypothetical protein
MKLNSKIKTESLGFMSMNLPTAFEWLVIGFLWLLIAASAVAQKVLYTKPSWKFGVAAGANFNYYNGSTHNLTSSFTPPVTFHKGDGIGLYLATSIEYYRPKSYLGFIFQAGFDSRKGEFNQV